MLEFSIKNFNGCIMLIIFVVNNIILIYCYKHMYIIHYCYIYTEIL